MPPLRAPDPFLGRKQSKTLHRPLSRSNTNLRSHPAFEFHSTRFLLIVLALSAFTHLALAAESKDVDSAIGTSSDMWATLVANVAPLLLLVGEKHVKAYFKTIRNQSHCLLYSIGPIGIITAITTLIRLNGVRTLKRLIGRQYESFPEVLADVTSVSKGDVGVEIRNDRLEQTITPTKDDVAIFYLRARQQGKYKDLHELTQKAMRPIEHDCDHGSIPPQWFAVVGLFQTKLAMGDDNGALTTLREMRRLITNYLFEHPSLTLQVNGGYGFEYITGFIEIFTGWEGISPSLTACFNGERESINGFRFMICVLCILGYIGIIIANWYVQRNLQNTLLVTVGLLTSTSGAYYTAMMVNSQSIETRTNLDFMGGLKSVCGYYSSSGRYGSLKSCPKSIISSTKAEYAGLARPLFPQNRGEQNNSLSLSKAMWVARPTFVIVAMTLGYVGLYLGLRTAEWWTSLSILAISVVASVARVLLVTDDEELVWKSMLDNPDRAEEENIRAPVSVDVNTPWPWTSPARMTKTNFLDCPQSVDVDRNGAIKAPSKPRNNTIKAPSASPNRTIGCNPGTDDSTIQLLRPAIISKKPFTYTILTVKSRQVANVNVGGEFGYDYLGQNFFANLLHGSLLVAKELHNRSLIPVELRSIVEKFKADPSPGSRHGRRGPSERHTQQRPVLNSKPVLLSDIIVQDGVWRQTLELVLNVSHSTPGNGKDSTPEISLNECNVHLGFWWLHSQKLRVSRDTASEINAIQISTDHSYYGSIRDNTYTQDNQEEDDEDDRSYSAQYQLDTHPPDDCPPDDPIPPSMFRDYIWMGAKICFALQLAKGDSRPEKKLQNLVQLMNDKIPNLNLQEYEAKSVVDCMENIGLAVQWPAERNSRATTWDKTLDG